MFQAAWTEVQGWRQALAEPGVARTIFLRLVLVALSSAVAVAAVGYVGPALAVLGTTLAVLVINLGWLRATGRP